MRNHQGFTLIELLIVISITVVLAGIGILNLFSYRWRQDLDLTANEIVSVLRAAQNYAISQESISSGEKWGVYFENGASDFYVLFRGVDYNNSVKVSKTSLRPTVEFTSGNIEVKFDLITGKTNNDYAVIINLKSNPSTQKTINIDKNGMVQF